MVFFSFYPGGKEKRPMNLFKLFGEIAIKNDAANKGIDETTDKAEKSSEDIKKAFSGLGEATVKVGKTIAKGLAVGAAAIGALVAAAESSREYRTEMGKLDTAFETSGHSAETAKKTYQELQSVLGETDQAVEAANHLAKLCDTEEELATWTEICTGVYGTFGASLPIEGLTEAANETARCGQLTGPLTDAINWAAKAGETFGVTLKENTAANKEWNEAVENATTAEEFFNLALQDCSTEQERQELIMKTLNGLYGDAAKKYKATNDELIKANQTTERMNELWGKVGDKIQPIVTTFKEGIADLGEALLSMVSDADVEEFSEALSDGFEFLAEEVIPVLIDGLTWVFEHIELIASVAVGAATAFLTYKAAVVAATVAQAAMTLAVETTTVAQTALNTAAASSPWGLVISLVVGAVAALATYDAITGDAANSTNALTEAQQKLVEETKNATDKIRDQSVETSESSGAILAERDYIKSLSGELMGLADSSGRVAEADRTRAEFILNELNEALGTEYVMVDGVIQKYGELVETIDEVIEKKTANALLDAHSERYTEAITRLDQTRDAYFKLKTEVDAAYKAMLAAQATLDKMEVPDGWDATTAWFIGSDEEIDAYTEAYLALQDALTAYEEVNKAWKETAVQYAIYTNNIDAYQKAEQAALEGDYETTIDILTSTGTAVLEFSDKVSQATIDTVEALRVQAIDAGLAAEEAKRNYALGIEGFGAETVAEAEEAYAAALEAFGTAYTDALAIGGNIGDGVSDGISGTVDEAVWTIEQFVADVTTAGNVAAGRNPIIIPTLTDTEWDGVWTGGGSVAEHYNLNGSHADGLDYVPFDGYVAELHKGEMVLPAESAEFVRAGGGNGAVVQMLGRILDAIEGSNTPSETSIVFNNREFGRLVRGVL